MAAAGPCFSARPSFLRSPHLPSHALRPHPHHPRGTSEQKAALIQGTTQLLVEALGKNPQTTVVVIDEVDTDNWGIGGETVTARRKQGK